ncbi:hypothetical protein ACFLZF_00705 [Nanoarchaeota archaeon]
MVVSTTLLIVGGLVIGIWLLIEFKRLKHKLFAVILIGLILFSYFSFSTIFSKSDIDFKSPTGLMSAGKVYFSWLISIFGNFKIITGDAIKMDWGTNQTTKQSD